MGEPIKVRLVPRWLDRRNNLFVLQREDGKYLKSTGHWVDVMFGRGVVEWASEIEEASMYWPEHARQFVNSRAYLEFVEEEE